MGEVVSRLPEHMEIRADLLPVGPLLRGDNYYPYEQDAAKGSDPTRALPSTGHAFFFSAHAFLFSSHLHHHTVDHPQNGAARLGVVIGLYREGEKSALLELDVPREGVDSRDAPGLAPDPS